MKYGPKGEKFSDADISMGLLQRRTLTNIAVLVVMVVVGEVSGFKHND